TLSSLGSYLQGGVQSLWTLAAFLCAYVAYLGQKQQQHSQTEDFRIQQESVKRQSFESAFFQLLHLHSQNIAEMRFIEKDAMFVNERREVSGRAALHHLYRILEDGYLNVQMRFVEYNAEKQTVGLPLIKDKDKDTEFLIKCYEEFHCRYQGYLGHYFRTFYHIIKFVKATGYDKETLRRYTSIARAQLSAAEIALLFYYGLSKYGKKDFKPLIEEFGLLENIDDALVKESLWPLYNESARK